MNERVFVLREAVVKITQLLTDKSIKVTQRGLTAYVKADHMGRPIVVNLPYLPDNATDELCFAIQGFLDHEVAHILFTDFTVGERAKSEGVFGVMNILEDARVEKAMGAKFSGSSSNLADVGEFFLREYTDLKLEEAKKSGDANKVVSVLAIPLMRGMSGQRVFKEYMKDKMHLVQDMYDKIKDLAEKMESAKTTEDCLKIAHEVKKRIEAKEGEGEESEDKSKSSSSKRSSGFRGENEEKGEGAGESKGEGGKGEGEEKEGEDEGEDEEKEGEDEEGEGEEKEGEEKEKEGEEKEGERGEGDSTATITEIAPSVFSEVEKEGVAFDESVIQIVSEMTAQAASSSSYVVYTKEDDVVENLKVPSAYRSEMFQRLADKTEHMIAPLQKDLERAIAARSLSVWENGRRSGRLSSSNLSRLAVNDSRVFRRKVESDTKDVAVELVIDASGSMNGGKIHLATQAAYALSSTLERIGIKNEVICFTTKDAPSTTKEYEKSEKLLGRRFSRYEPLYMPILKGFNERINSDTKMRFGWLPNASSSLLKNNVDGECVEIAARRLLARREAGKVMIVLSDGQPSAACASGLQRHLKETVHKIEGSGVKVVGIGIMTSAVTNYYSKHIIVNDINALPAHVMKELRHLLVG
ncbi:hypothetical protein [Ferrovum sp.]|uniref:cobaltochelatase CobT-related protein n=1 Tax=Ferrovum sp. TaxID=2609467 RepID=UPI002606D9AE|nr:hypothetical protein [Ferrovum sp.]